MKKLEISIFCCTMIYYTGDTHGDVEKQYNFKERFGLTADDTIVILGDAGWNYDDLYFL